MKTIPTIILSVIFIIACASESDLMKVTVVTDENELVMSPVAVEIELPGVENNTPCCLIYGGTKIPGQIERVNDKKARVWFVVDQPAHESRTYEVRIRQNCGDGSEFVWEQLRRDATRLVFNGRQLLQYEHPVFDPENIEETKKPYHHVSDPDGSSKITKGLGGLYPHHRGIFFGYNKIFVNGNEYDVWHAQEGEHTQHVEFAEIFRGPVMGGHIVRIEWRGRDGEPFIEELREIRVFRQTEDQSLIDFRSSLYSLKEAVILDGDLHHAGVQFRASQHVADYSEHSRFLRPVDWAELAEDEEFGPPELMDLPWNAFRFPIEDRKYTVTYMSHPDNPDGAEFSERLYGRFGEFFTYELTPDNPLYVNYRFWIAADEVPSREHIEKRYRAFAYPPGVYIE
jgi:hypothetical protein